MSSWPSEEGAQLEWLRRKLQWLAAVAAFLGIGWMALLVWVMVPHGPALEAQRFVLRDPLGKRRAELGFLEGSPMLRLNNPNERARLMLLVRDDGTAKLRLTDANGHNRAEFALQSSGATQLLMREKTGHAVVEIGATPDGASGIALRGSDQRLRWSVP